MNYDKNRYWQSRMDLSSIGRLTCPFHSIFESFRQNRLYGGRRMYIPMDADYFEEQFVKNEIEKRNMLGVTRRNKRYERNTDTCLTHRQLVIQAGRAEVFINSRMPKHVTRVIVDENTMRGVEMYEASDGNTVLRIIVLGLWDKERTYCRGLANVEISGDESDDPVNCGIRIHRIDSSDMTVIYHDNFAKNKTFEELTKMVEVYRENRRALGKT